MSLKRQLGTQYGQVLHFFRSLELPRWMTGTAMRLGLLMLLIGSSTAYILKMSSSVALGYQIKGLETSITELTAEQQKLAVEVASYRSMASIQSRLAELRMVPIVHIDHVVSPAAELAIAKK